MTQHVIFSVACVLVGKGVGRAAFHTRWGGGGGEEGGGRPPQGYAGSGAEGLDV